MVESADDVRAHFVIQDSLEVDEGVRKRSPDFQNYFVLEEGDAGP